MTTLSTAEVRLVASSGARWWQLIFGIVCMVMVANLQLGWSPFVDPIDQKYHWGRYAIQWAFTIFVLTQTWLVPLHGYLIDRFGPRVTISIAGILVGTAWVLNSYADSLVFLYAAAVIGGLGVGAVYGLLSFAHDPLLFVLLSGLVFFAWGEIYALFPAMCADLYGRKFATANYGLLYTAKGMAALMVPLANLLPAGTESWKTVFMIAAGFDVLAALLAIVALKPLRKRLLASDR